MRTTKRLPEQVKDDALVTIAYWLDHDHLQNIITTDAYVMRMAVIRRALGRDPLAGVQR